MKEYLMSKQPNVITKVYNHPENYGLRYKEYGHSENIKDYSTREISQMLKGVYLHKNHLLVDGDYFIDVNDVIQAGCTLKSVTSYLRLDLSKPIPAKSVRTFYMENYYLITRNKINGTNKHSINSFLIKMKALRPGHGNFRGLYALTNYYKFRPFKQEPFPKNLSYPISLFFKDLFFKNQDKKTDFIVDSQLTII